MRRRQTFLLGLLSSLAVLAGLASSLSDRANANMTYIPQPLEKTTLAAQIVAHVRVTKITATLCGTDYLTEVLKSYKGKTERSLTFAARRSPITNLDREVSQGDELLVLLSPRSPTQEPYGNCCSDGTARTSPQAELQCRTALSALTPLANFESAFLLEKRSGQADGTPTVWFWYDRLRTELPADIAPKDPRTLVAGKCSSPLCVASWKTIEPRIRQWAKTSAK